MVSAVAVLFLRWRDGGVVKFSPIGGVWRQPEEV